MSSGYPICSTLPCDITAMRSLITSASSWSCVTYTNVTPTSRWMRISSSCICLRSLRSSAPSGSSSRSTAGSFTSARAERDPLLLAAGELRRAAVVVAVQLHEVEVALDPVADVALRDLLAPQPERDVVGDGQVREQRVRLEDRVDVALERRDADDVAARQLDPARSRALRIPQSCAARSSCRSLTDRASRRTRPRPTVIVTSSTATMSPKRFVTP